MRATLIFIIGLFILSDLAGQMVVGNDTLYGNEWIDFDQTYYKIKLADDGVYRISYEEMIENGIELAGTSGLQFQVYRFGEEIPLHVSTNGSFESGDYIEFVGKKNRGELDEHIYPNGLDDQLNPLYSLFSDTSTYFLAVHENPIGLRFDENPTNSNGNVLPYYVHEEVEMFSNFHHKPTYNGNDHVQYSHFDVSEGYGSRLEKETIIELETSNVFQTVQYVPTATVRFGSNPNSHETQIGFNGTLMHTENFFGFDAKEITFDLSYDDIEATNELDVVGNASEFDKYSIAFANIKYPRETVFQGQYFEFLVEANPFEKSYEFDYPGGEYVIYDLENNHRTVGEVSNGKLKFTIAPGDKDRKVIVTSNVSNTVSSMTSKEFIDLSEVNPNFLFLTSSKLYNPNDPDNAVKLYADYRASMAGGSYDTYIVTADEVIDQFAYGVDRHNIGNRNFAFFVQDRWPLEYWYNVGKALEYSSIRLATNDSDLFTQAYHVPTFGAPGSDVMMLSKDNEAYPIYNVGRVAIQSEEDLLDYLAKVIQHDDKGSWAHTFEDRYWLKNVLHLSGGDAQLQQPIFSHLEAMRTELEDNLYGAEVQTVRKFNSTTIDQSLADFATALIDNGVSIITFFGHSSPGTFDLNLEDPSQFGNFGKYPFIISLGCFSGNIHTTSGGLSEDFVLEPEKAAIAMLASSGTAYVSSQAVGGFDLYDRLGGDYYTKTISSAIRSVQFKNISESSISQRTLMQQLNYHGDPGLKLWDTQEVDITFDKSTISTIPEIVNPRLDTFEVVLDLVNLGATIQDTFDVKFIHYGPSGTVLQEKTIRTTAPYNRKEISVSLDVPDIESLGKNSLEIIIDTGNELVEGPLPDAIENNSLKALTNDVGHCFYLLDNGIRPIFPMDFAILNDNCDFELRASTNNAFLPEAKYHFEIDTTEFFNSPLLEKGEVLSKGGILSYTPSIPQVEDQVYYWRVSPDSLDTDIGLIWNNSSFVYEAQEENGWNQSHFFQYKKNTPNFLEVSDESRKFVFNREIIDYRFDLSSQTAPDLRVFVKTVPWGSLNPHGGPAPCANIGSFLGIHARHPELYVLNNQTGSDFGSFTCVANQLWGYHMTDLNDCENVINLLESFPYETRLFVYTYLVGDDPNLNTDLWDDEIPSMGMSLIDYFVSKGASKVNGVITDGTVPYVLVFDVGIDGVILEEIRSHHSEELHATTEGYRTRQEGTMNSVRIGPAQSWNRFEWSFEKEDSDDIYVNVYGVQNDGTLEPILTEVRDPQFSLADLNESGYQFMEFEIYASDFSQRTAPNIEFLKVIYTPAPDIAINTSSNDFSFNSDTLQQGNPITLEIPLDNITPYDMGSGNMEFTILSETNETIIDTISVASIEAKSTGRAVWSYDTKDLEGKYLLTSVYNAEKNPVEQTYSNNFGVKEFIVTTDKTNPVLEMTFDGVDILDGDIVSCTPEIQINLNDNNEFLLLDDPSLFEVTLTPPNSNSGVELEVVNNPDFIFEAATDLNDNIAKLIFTPQLDEEGVYTITVNAKDKTGNSSGTVGLSKSFEIIKTRSISNVFNYPNPFSTSTQFVFTVTGDMPPINLHLNIYTLSGKLVKQILPEELGPIRVGVNRTEFKWDGRDEFGSRLANGTYLYKVKYDDPNGDFEAYGTSADNLFTDGFGKMVIMR